MHKELHSIQLIRDYLVSKEIVSTKTTSIEDSFEFFNYLKTNQSKFNSLYILNYLRLYIVSDDVAKRKTSSRVFEDLLAILFNGEIADGKKRKNISTDVPDYFNFSKDKIAGNKREKIDLLFEDDYGISLKTLMMSNKEINLGSFEKKVLFDGLNVTQYLTERKTDEDIGLGSTPRLKGLLNRIKDEGNYDTFSERFTNMFNYIFADDFLLAIKDKTILHLYFYTGEEFTSFVTSRVNNIDSLMEVVNRWEGNSIRIDRALLLESCTRVISLDLELLDETVIKSVNEMDFKLHQTYIEYFNGLDKSTLKKDLNNEIEELFDRFDENITILEEN